jgi:O-antigen/teichoic acid export membrane protein
MLAATRDRNESDVGTSEGVSPQWGGEPPQAPPDAARETTGASLISGGTWQVASRLLPQLTTIILSVAIARLLGPPDFGRQSFIAFVSLSATTLVSAGMSIALTRYGAELLGRREGGAVWRLVRLTAAIDLLGALVAGAVLAVAGALGAEPAAAWQFAGLATALSIMQTVPNSVLMGGQRFREAAVIGLTTNLVAAPAVIVVVAMEGGIVGIFAVQALVAAVNLAWTFAVARRTLRAVAPAETELDPRTRSLFMRFAAITTLDMLLFLIVWRRSEFFFLDAYSTNAEIAIYSIAFAAVSALVLIPQTLATVMSPAFATLHGAGQWERIRSGYGRAMRLVTLAALPLAAAGFALGPAAIEVIYGGDYSGAGPVLLVMLGLFLLMPAFSVSSALLEGLGRAVVPLVLGAIAGAVNIGLDFLLIPRWDAIGAAAANTIAQSVVIIPLVVYTLRLTGRVPLHLAALARAAVASGAAGAAAWAVYWTLGGALGLLCAMALGVSLLAALTALLRVLSAEDAAWLDDAAGARLGGLVGRVCRMMTGPPPAQIT